MAFKVIESVESRFWKKVKKGSGNSCWEWTGFHAKDEYGEFFVSQTTSPKLWKAHRYSWQLHNEPIPPGLLVCHRCDNKICVRPDHLFLGTHSDNLKDAVSKGRHPMQLHPESSHLAKLARRVQFATHCKRGHRRTTENSYLIKDGFRRCRVCVLDRGRKRDYKLERRHRAASGGT